MFFFRLNSNFCILRKSRIANSPKDFFTFDGPSYLSTACLREAYRLQRTRATGKPVQSHSGNLGHPNLAMKNSAPSRRQPKLHLGGSLMAVGLFCCSPTLDAYEAPLTPAALHDAWTLGQRNDQATAEFLAPYSKQVTEGSQQVPHIAEIEVLTPFAQVVDESRQNMSGYSEQQAAQAYRQRGDSVIVRIRLMLPSAYPEAERSPNAPPASRGQTAALRPENFWQSFHFAFKQHGKVLEPRSIHNKPVYSAATKASSSTLDGQTVWMDFDARSVASDEIVVEVTTPDGKTVSVNFDLRQLR